MQSNVTTYHNQQILTASPAKLVSMLYDKAIVCLKEAIAAIERRDVEGRWRANARAFEIISHMSSTLDREKGGDIAQNLDELFNYMMSRLPDVDLHNDPEPARDMISLLEPIAESWRALARGQGAPSAASQQDVSTPESMPRMPTSLSA